MSATFRNRGRQNNIRREEVIPLNDKLTKQKERDEEDVTSKDQLYKRSEKGINDNIFTRFLVFLLLWICGFYGSEEEKKAKENGRATFDLSAPQEWVEAFNSASGEDKVSVNCSSEAQSLSSNTAVGRASRPNAAVLA